MIIASLIHLSKGQSRSQPRRPHVMMAEVHRYMVTSALVTGAPPDEHQRMRRCRLLAEAATGERREVLNELAAVERRHAAHWAAKLVELGEPVPEQGPAGVRTRVLAWLARRVSVEALLPYLERAERADAGLYQDDPDATSKMAIDERSHSRVLTQLRDSGVDDPGDIRRLEPR